MRRRKDTTEADAHDELLALERRLVALKEAREEIAATETAIGRMAARLRERLQSPDGRCVGS